MTSVLLLLAGSGLAFSQPNPLSTAPFLLGPVGMDHLGWLTPDQCSVNERCDVVVVDPLSGRLYLEQSDDLMGTRVYSDRSWGLSHRIEYEIKENLVHTVEDFWSTSISYRYDGRNLVQIDWSDGRSIRVEYDRRGRVQMMTDDEHRLDFVWGRDGSHRMVDATGKTLNWVVSDTSIRVTDSLGMTASALYQDGTITGWIDPRGLETRLEYTPEGLRLEQAGLRVWNIRQTNGRLTELELAGSGSWRWQYDSKGRLTQVTDPTMNKLTLLRENDRSVRMLRHNGFVDLSYSVEGYLEGVSDVRGRLVSIERDVYGQIVRLEDAVGEAFVFEREESGLIRKITLRNGGEWIVERDGDGCIRNIVFPNQEVWGFTRDAWGNLTGIDRSHDGDVEFGWTNGSMTSISFPNDETWMLRRDGYNRLNEVRTPSGYVRLQRDVLGQIIGVTAEQEQVVSVHETPNLVATGDASILTDPLLAAIEPAVTDPPVFESTVVQQTWSIERDVFGNIVSWQDIALDVGAWDAIESHRQGDTLWKWHRDAAGRLIGIEANEERIDIAYDGSGMPIRWSRGDMVSTVKRNHWGWVTNVDEQWLQHDPRGQVEKSGIYDLSWRWNRNAGGYPLVVKGPYQIQVGFEVGGDGSIERIRFPNGELQTFRLQQSGLAQWHTNEQGQEFTLPVVPRSNWNPSFQLHPETVTLQHTAGVHTIDAEGGLRTIEYDPFHFVREICDLTSCLQLTYDPRGRLIEVEDGTGLPTRIVWGWNGWSEAPILIGGTIGFHSPLGMIVQSAGEQNKLALFWHHEKSNGVTQQPFVDAAHFEQGRLSWIDGSFSSRGQRLYLEDLERSLQNEQPWMADGNETTMFEFVSERSVWNNPIDLLEQLGIVEFSEWSNPEDVSPMPWVSSAWLETHQPWAMNPTGVPITEGELETWFIQQILAGKSDPSSNEVLFMLINEPDIQSVLTGDYPFHSTKCIPELAQFHSCG